MLRLCSRRLLNNVPRLRVLSSVSLNCKEDTQVLKHDTIRAFSTQTSLPAEYPCSDPDSLLAKYEWAEAVDWDMDWYDGRDTLHIRVNKTDTSTSFRGISFYSREGYWMGALRWNERLRGGKPAVWLHWVGKDPIEMANSLPSADHSGGYTFSVKFTKNEFVMHCNGELLGIRKNMLFQYKNVARVWFADLEEVNGRYMIEGEHTNDSGFAIYKDVPMFKKMSDVWKAYRLVKSDHDEKTFPDHGWRA